MRLEKMKLSGFKSFVDPTVIEFPSNLVGVIGPNGCGKSNIIDAVRWVLGESSAKMLRGESMTDVIFNGSSERKPVGLASVELIFDNSDGTVGGEYAGFSQISVRREVNREAQSTYFLNNTRCRRKDIFNAFYGTGLGARSYSVIEQGMISRFIEAKPEELRTYLEEVAGISKYKARRRETENRIKHTRENLARLTDIREELEKQLNTLQRQAQAAERYKVLKAEEHLLKGQLTVLHWRDIQVQLDQFEQQLQEKLNNQEAKKAQLQHIETEMEAARQHQQTSNDTYQQQQQRYYAIANEVTRLEQAIAHQKERQQQLFEDQSQLESDYQSTQAHIEEDKDQIAQLQSDIDILTPDLAAAKSAVETAETELHTAETNMQQWQQQWDAFNEKAASVSQATTVEKTKISHLQTQIQSLHDQQIRYETQLAQIDLDALSSSQTELSAQLTSMQSKQQAGEQTLSDVSAAHQAAQDSEATLKQALDALYVKQRELAAKQATLAALQQAALGQSEGKFADWLAQHNLKNTPRLLNQLTVEKGWETAVETVLGEYLEALCVDDASTFVKQLDQMPEGRLMMLDKSTGTASASAAGSLNDKVTSEWPIAAYLSSVKTAKDVAQALSMRQTLGPQDSVITPQGLWFGVNWVRVSKSTHEQGNTIEREKALTQLAVDLKTLASEIQSKETALADNTEKLAQLTADKSAQQDAVMSLNVQLAELQSQSKVLTEKLASDTEVSATLTQDIEQTKTQIDEAEQALSKAKEAFEAAVSAQKEDDTVRETLSGQREDFRQALQQAKQQHTESTTAYHEYQVRLETCKSQLDTLQQTVDRLQSRLSELTERQAQLKLAISATENPEQNLEAELKLKLDEHVDAEAALKTAKVDLDNVSAQMTSLEQQRLAEEQAISQARDALEKVKLDRESLRVRSQTLLEQLEGMELVFAKVNEELEETATVATWQETLSRVENKIMRLGAINLAAADEFKTHSERKTYLDAQNEDLTKALTLLEDAISKIDKETKARFSETFNTVNATFKEIFPKVFGGGSAYLELQDEDLLSTGVTVFARPPGKKNSTIHLLSGGEKALTAISLVFAIFQLNPAPFCMLDEVDAPLDDVNLLRYCSLVKEMAEKVQFIFVTHNKIAMEMANQLMGVTMHEPGVSRLVTVDVEEAVELSQE